MLKKQILKVRRAYNDKIVSISESNSIYVDNQFYVQHMDERPDDPDCSSFPVKVVAIRVGWMLRSSDGIDGRYFL